MVTTSNLLEYAKAQKQPQGPAQTQAQTHAQEEIKLMRCIHRVGCRFIDQFCIYWRNREK